LLWALCEKHSVTLISFVNPEESISPQSFPSPRPEKILITPYLEFKPYSSQAILGFFSSKPRWIVDTHRSEMELLIRQAIAKTRFDVIIASQTEMASYHRCFNGIPAIFEEVELGCFYPDESGNRSLLQNMRMRFSWLKHRRFIANLLPHFSLCTVASEIERRMLAEAATGYHSIHVIPNSIDMESYKTSAIDRAPDSLVFSGSLRYSANLDAMTWFLNDVYPIIRSKREDVRLTITGDWGSGRLPQAPNIVQTGRVQDVRELIAGSMVSIAPIRIGGGTRFKILESFALCTPVVATSKAAEGLEAQNGKHLLVADTPEDFASSVLRLLENAAEARCIAERAFNLVRARYDWRSLSPDFLHLVDQAATNTRI
jgi:polysaccharide biosynthesis protein PslH